MNWSLYLVVTTDNMIYCGIAKDVMARFRAHQKGSGSKFLRAHKPLHVYKVEEFESRSLAQKREHEIKSFTRAQKEELLKISLLLEESE